MWEKGIQSSAIHEMDKLKYLHLFSLEDEIKDV